jgi:hypothetical protein
VGSLIASSFENAQSAAVDCASTREQKAVPRRLERGLFDV